MKSKYLTIGLIVSNVLMLVSFFILPNRISKSIEKSMGQPQIAGSKDSVVKIISKDIMTSSQFIYFKGTLEEKPFKIEDEYTLSSDVPESINNGYLTLFKGDDDVCFFIWSKRPLPVLNVRGWFLTNNKMGKYQNGKTETYVQVLFPVTETLMEKSNIVTL